MRKKITPREDVPQRKRAPPERVKPLTLGRLAAGGVERIECECHWCRHEAATELTPLLAKLGADKPYREVSARLKCSRCGWHEVSARPIWPNSPKDRTGYRTAKFMPLPPRDECRAVIAAVPPDPAAQLVDQRAAKIRALRERFPTLTASQALFVVQALVPNALG